MGVVALDVGLTCVRLLLRCPVIFHYLAGEDVEKKEPRALLLKMQTGAATTKNSMKFPQIIKNRNAT